MNFQKWIRKKIIECEGELEKTKITIITASDYAKLLEIHNELWQLLYFKTHQEKYFLIKLDKEKKK